MMMLLMLLLLVFALAALIPVTKVLLGFYGFEQALGAWTVLIVLSWVL
jgi:hypothetical protein